MNKIINHNNSSVFSTIAFLIIIITGLKLGSSIILPLMMAFFLYIICLPIVNKLDSSKVPNFITSLAIITLVVVLIFMLNSFLISSSNEIMKNIPTYQEKFYTLIPKLVSFFKQFDISINKDVIISFIEPSKIVHYITTVFKSMGNIIMYIVLTLALFMFLLFESPLVLKKSRYFTKLDKDNLKFKKFLYSINRYFALKTFTSIITGIMIYFMLIFFNLEYALLFAVLAFLLNYLPTVGAILAAFPAIFIAILQLNTIDVTFITIGYLFINIFIGSFLDPKLMGKDLGLSTFIVFLSMLIWGWIFGPLGIFLAVPLTITIKIVVENHKKYHWIAILLSDNIEEK